MSMRTLLVTSKRLARFALSRSVAWLLAELADALARKMRRAIPSPATLEDDTRDAANAVPLQDDPHDALEWIDAPGSAVSARVEELVSGEVVGLYEIGRFAAMVPLSKDKRENAYDLLIAKSGARYGVPPAIVKAVVANESSFRPGAIREEPRIRTRSRGLMQLLETTAKALGFKDAPQLLHDPAISIDLGTRLLRQLFDRWGSWRDALAAYNGGRPRKVASGELEPRLLEYVNRVRKHLARWGVVLDYLEPPKPPPLVQLEPPKLRPAKPEPPGAAPLAYVPALPSHPVAAAGAGVLLALIGGALLLARLRS